jgi:hypothetical protein
MPGPHHAFILALLLALPSIAFALSASSSAIADIANAALPAGQEYSVQQFEFKNASAFAIVSDNEIYALFASGLPLLEGHPLTGEADISRALEAYYPSQGYSPWLSFADIHAGLLSVSENYKKGEAKCRQITGTDVLPCDSYDSCRVACLGTPFCPNFANGGKPGEFIHVLLAFENNSKLLGQAYLDESAAYSPLLDGISPREAEAYLESLSGLNRAATRASQSPLYTDYSYCFEPDYSLPVITNMQLSAQKAYAQSRPFLALNSTAQQVRQRTLAALELQSSMLPAEANRTSAGANASAAPENNSSVAPVPLPESPPVASPLGSIFLPAAAALALTVLFLFGAHFIAKRKKAKGL